MKIILTIIMCSTLANTCMEPHTFNKTYNNNYDCSLDGYNKSLEKLEEIGKTEINEYGIYFKFGCKELIVPKEKPDVKT